MELIDNVKAIKKLSPTNKNNTETSQKFSNSRSETKESDELNLDKKQVDNLNTTNTANTNTNNTTNITTITNPTIKKGASSSDFLIKNNLISLKSDSSQHLTTVENITTVENLNDIMSTPVIKQHPSKTEASKITHQSANDMKKFATQSKLQTISSDKKSAFNTKITNPSTGTKTVSNKLLKSVNPISGVSGNGSSKQLPYEPVMTQPTQVSQTKNILDDKKQKQNTMTNTNSTNTKIQVDSKNQKINKVNVNASVNNVSNTSMPKSNLLQNQLQNVINILIFRT